MAKKENTEKKTEALLKPILDQNGFELVDVEFIKEGGVQYLRAYIDKSGGIRIDDCELVSRALSTELDKADFIEDAYTLEISSPGLLRPFKKDRDFERHLGQEAELHLFKALNGAKEYVGILKAYSDDEVVLEFDDGELSFPRKDISLIRPYIDFSDL